MSDTEFKQRVGTTLRGKWKLDRLIGIGGMAAVYAATHKIGRIDAIKLLDPAIAVSPELRARFEQEARAVNSIGHPGAVEVRDIDETEDGTPFLVMELLEGQTIAERMAEGKALGPSELLRLTDELLDVLAAAHDKHIIHRDIKPENLFVLRDGRLKVLDFGIARMRDGVRTMVGTMMGTLAYMPPEQIKGLNVDQRADLFAVGATMFRVLAGRTVHVAENDWLLGSRILQHPAPLLASVAPAVPEWICWLVDRALKYRPEDRYPDARTMQGDVRAVRDGREPPFAAAKLREPAADDAGPARPAAPAVASDLGQPSDRVAATRSDRPAPAVAKPAPEAEPVHVATKAFPFGVAPARQEAKVEDAPVGASARPKVPTDKQLPVFAEQPTTAPQLPAFVVGGKADSKAARPGVPPTQPQMPAFPEPAQSAPPSPELVALAPSSPEPEMLKPTGPEPETSETSESAGSEPGDSDGAPANDDAVAAPGDGDVEAPPDTGKGSGEEADRAAAPHEDDESASPEPPAGEAADEQPTSETDEPAAAAEPSEEQPASSPRRAAEPDEPRVPAGKRKLSTARFVALLVVVAAVAAGYWAYATGRLQGLLGGPRPPRATPSQQAAPVASSVLSPPVAAPPPSAAVSEAPDASEEADGDAAR